MRGILFDMDGVLYNGDEPIAGAAEAVRWARQQSIPHLFLTNTSSRSRDVLIEKLARFGIEATKDEILTPPAAAAQWLAANGEGGHAALFVAPKTLPEFDGLQILAADAESGADYVVIGDLGEAWNFRTLNRAFRLLRTNPNAKLIALGMTKFWQAPDGLRLDVAPFVAALECATGRQAMVFGKPSELFFHAAARKLDLPPGELLMIGDDIEVDIGGAQAAGLKGALVKTGKFRAGDLSGEVKPDALVDSVADVPGLWDSR